MIKISTPGRICLFGEHQDYLGLPVIAAAISRRVDMSGEHRADKQIVIHLINIFQISNKNSFFFICFLRSFCCKKPIILHFSISPSSPF